MGINTVNKGRFAEQKSVEFLQNNGFEILDQNWRIRRLEIDIIALKNYILHIIEVKALTDTDLKNPEEAVNNKKIKNLIEAANEYIIEKNYDLEAQFDIIAIKLSKNFVNKVISIDFIENAFYPTMD